jgi:general secretion pathway protein B
VRNAPAAVAAASRPAPAATSPAPQQAPVEEPIPGLTVNVVAYSEEPARRFVMINLKSYKEGERTAEGAVVEEIQPDGAVVSYKGRRVRLHP